MGSIMSVLIAIIPIILELMQIADQEFGQGTGALKKESVLSSIQAIINNPETWGKVSAVLSGVIDLLAKLHFGAKT